MVRRATGGGRCTGRCACGGRCVCGCGIIRRTSIQVRYSSTRYDHVYFPDELLQEGQNQLGKLCVRVGCGERKRACQQQFHLLVRTCSACLLLRVKRPLTSIVKLDMQYGMEFQLRLLCHRDKSILLFKRIHTI